MVRRQDSLNVDFSASGEGAAGTQFGEALSGAARRRRRQKNMQSSSEGGSDEEVGRKASDRRNLRNTRSSLSLNAGSTEKKGSSRRTPPTTKRVVVYSQNVVDTPTPEHTQGGESPDTSDTGDDSDEGSDRHTASNSDPKEFPYHAHVRLKYGSYPDTICRYLFYDDQSGCHAISFRSKDGSWSEAPYKYNAGLEELSAAEVVAYEEKWQRDYERAQSRARQRKQDLLSADGGAKPKAQQKKGAAARARRRKPSDDATTGTTGTTGASEETKASHAVVELDFDEDIDGNSNTTRPARMSSAAPLPARGRGGAPPPQAEVVEVAQPAAAADEGPLKEGSSVRYCPGSNADGYVGRLTRFDPESFDKAYVVFAPEDSGFQEAVERLLPMQRLRRVGSPAPAVVRRSRSPSPPLPQAAFLPLSAAGLQREMEKGGATASSRSSGGAVGAAAAAKASAPPQKQQQQQEKKKPQPAKRRREAVESDDDEGEEEEVAKEVKQPSRPAARKAPQKKAQQKRGRAVSVSSSSSSQEEEGAGGAASVSDSESSGSGGGSSGSKAGCYRVDDIVLLEYGSKNWYPARVVCAKNAPTTYRVQYSHGGHYQVVVGVKALQKIGVAGSAADPTVPKAHTRAFILSLPSVHVSQPPAKKARQAASPSRKASAKKAAKKVAPKKKATAKTCKAASRTPQRPAREGDSGSAAGTATAPRKASPAQARPSSPERCNVLDLDGSEATGGDSATTSGATAATAITAATTATTAAATAATPDFKKAKAGAESKEAAAPTKLSGTKRKSAAGAAAGEDGVAEPPPSPSAQPPQAKAQRVLVADAAVQPKSAQEARTDGVAVLSGQTALSTTQGSRKATQPDAKLLGRCFMVPLADGARTECVRVCRPSGGQVAGRDNTALVQRFQQVCRPSGASGAQPERCWLGCKLGAHTHVMETDDYSRVPLALLTPDNEVHVVHEAQTPHLYYLRAWGADRGSEGSEFRWIAPRTREKATRIALIVGQTKDGTSLRVRYCTSHLEADGGASAVCRHGCRLPPSRLLMLTDEEGTVELAQVLPRRVEVISEDRADRTLFCNGRKLVASRGILADGDRHFEFLGRHKLKDGVRRYKSMMVGQTKYACADCVHFHFRQKMLLGEIVEFQWDTSDPRPAPKVLICEMEKQPLPFSHVVRMTARTYRLPLQSLGAFFNLLTYERTAPCSEHIASLECYYLQDKEPPQNFPKA